MSSAAFSLPPDDPTRALAVSNTETAPHLGIAGGTYTITLSGEETAGRLSIIEMYVPSQAGPPPHRHDFEETFILLEGTLEFTFRGAKQVAQAGDTVHVPANAPHRFQNISGAPARMICICSPAGQEEFFRQIGTPVATRTASAPPLDEAARAAMREKAGQLAATYRTEFLEKA